MHKEALEFILYVKNKFPEYFKEKRVLDCGSGDINGNNRELFINCNYTGIDISDGKNVDIVSKISDFKSDNKYDTIISSECFEHDIEYVKSLNNIVFLLKENGLLVFTCASFLREEHGTKRQHSGCNFATMQGDIIFNKSNWYPNYYKNLHYNDIFEIDFLHRFINFEFSYNENSKDLYFWGIKKTVENLDFKSNKFNLMNFCFNRYNTDKNEKFHNYPKYYNKYFKEYENKNINFLEIGVYEGESLKAWREYLKNAINIVGIDINPNCQKLEMKDFNIFVEIGDQTDKHFLELISKKYNNFDIILDDGSHNLNDIIISFETLFPLLNNNGIYVIEDVICIRDNLNYFFNLVQCLNKWRKDVGGDNCVDPGKINYKTNNPIEYSVSDIIFINSAIIIKKEIKENWIMEN